MAKLKENTIDIFNNDIYGKVQKSKAIKKEFDNLTEQLKEMDHKIEYYRKKDEYAQVTKLKHEQSKLEDEIVALDEKIKTSDFSISDNEFDSFYSAYNSEMAEIKKEHEKYRKQMKEKLKEAAEVYRKMIENKNEAGRRISRIRFVKQEQKHPHNIHNNYKGQILPEEVRIGGNTTSRDYSWLLEDMLEEESLTDFQKYHFGKAEW